MLWSGLYLFLILRKEILEGVDWSAFEQFVGMEF